VVCFYLDLSVAFLRAAVDYACAQGAVVVEGYPVDPVVDEAGNWSPPKNYRFMGYTSTFLKAGFQDVTPEGNPRRIMRKE
jgi:hypothetical protein